LNHDKYKLTDVIELNKINLKKVNDSDIKFLYILLKARNPKTNISHREMPDFDHHKKFVLSKPYSKWYIIYYKLIKIGSVYISKQNEIGINLKKQHDLESIKKRVLNEIVSTDLNTNYFVNVSPKNKKGVKFFEKNGWKLIQKTFEIPKFKKELNQK
jgi:hypothetical protein